MVLQAEEAIASFLDDITNNNAENLASKARVVGQMLLQLGVKLPIGGKF